MSHRPPIVVPESLREGLAAALLEEADLIDALRSAQRTEQPERPGFYNSECTVAVRRPLDLETAELKQLTVTLQWVNNAWEVFSVAGLEDVAAEASD